MLRSANIEIERGSEHHTETHLFVEERANLEFQPPDQHARVNLRRVEEDVEIDRLINIQSTSAHFYWVRNEKAGGKDEDELRVTGNPKIKFCIL